MVGSEKVFLVIGLINLILLPIVGIYLTRAYLEKPWFRKRFLGDIQNVERRRELRQKILIGIPVYTRLYRAFWGICIVYTLLAVALSYYLVKSGSPGIWFSVLSFIGSVLLIVLVMLKIIILTRQYVARRLDEANSTWW